MPAWLPLAMAAAQYAGNRAAAVSDSRRNLGYQKQMLGLEQQAQYQMWQKTGPVGQVAEYEKAGLNPGLMYGMGMTGGGTTGNASGSGAAQQRTPPIDLNSSANMAMTMAQMDLINAQKANIEADTENKKASAKYTGGAQTKKTEAETTYTSGAQTDLTDAQIGKTKAEMDKTIAETGIRRIELDIADKTSNEQIAMIRQNARRIESEARSAAAKTGVDEATIATRINQEKANLLATAVYIKLMNSQRGLTEAQAWATAESVAQKWKGLATERMNALNQGTATYSQWEKNANDRMVNDLSESTKLNYEWAGDVIKGVGLPLTLHELRGSQNTRPPEVKGFRK